jgi:hypothetical protein
MVSSYTPNKEIEKPANGDYNNTWSTPVNNDWDIIDQAFGGRTSLNVTGVSGNVTLSLSEYRSPIITLGNTLSNNITYRIPSGVGGFWYIYNNTTGSFTVTLANVAGGTTVTLAQGFMTACISDGTNIRRADNAPGSGSTGVTSVSLGTTGLTPATGTTGAVVVAGTLNVANGGTGATTLASGSVLLGAGTSAVTTVAPGAANNVLTSNGTTWVSQAGGGSSGVSSITFGSTGLTPSTASTGAVTVAGTLAVANGGTGQTTYTNGQLLIGNTTGNTLAKATLTAGSGITITNGAGTITIAATAGGGGTVTSVSGTGSTNGLTLSGTVTTSGSITLGGSVTSVATGATIDGVVIGYRNIPRSTTTTTMTAADVGKCIAVTAGIALPNNSTTFAAGDSISIYNNSGSSIAITQGTTITLYLAGTATTGTRSLAQRGIATIWFNSSTDAVISGGGLT